MRSPLIAALALVVLVVIVGVQQAQTPQPPLAEQTALSFAEHLLAENYDAAAALFDPALAEVVSQTRLLEVWNSLRFYGGEANELLHVIAGKESVVVIVAFERLNCQISLSILPSGRIISLYFTLLSRDPRSADPGLVIDPSASALPPAPTADAGADDPAPERTAEVEATPTATVTAAPAPSATPTLIALDGDMTGADIGALLAELLRRGSYNEAVALFDARLASILPAARLGRTWEALIAARGAVQTVESIDADQPGVVIVLLTLEGGRAALDIRLDEAGRVYSLYFR